MTESNPVAPTEKGRPRIRTSAEADALPVGSVIADITEPTAPATACKAARGDWQFLGGDPLRRYWSAEVFPADGSPIRNLTVVVLWNPEEPSDA